VSEHDYKIADLALAEWEINIMQGFNEFGATAAGL